MTSEADEAPQCHKAIFKPLTLIPDLIIHKIFLFLNVDTVVAFAGTNKLFNKLVIGDVTSNLLWRELCKREGYVNIDPENLKKNNQLVFKENQHTKVLQVYKSWLKLYRVARK